MRGQAQSEYSDASRIVGLSRGVSSIHYYVPRKLHMQLRYTG
jgi:hypothetical protein